MTYRIDLHTHTRNSDGCGSILELARRAHELEYCCLVLTDHDVPEHAIEACRAELRTLQEHVTLPLPVILGAEIHTPFGECLLFGEEAVTSWVYTNDDLWNVNKISSHLWLDAFYQHILYTSRHTFSLARKGVRLVEPLAPRPYGLVLCHPNRTAEDYRQYPQEFYDLLSGYEVQNGRREFAVTAPDVMTALAEMCPHGKKLRNSDTHHVRDMGAAFNEIEQPITTEVELIAWLDLSNP